MSGRSQPRYVILNDYDAPQPGMVCQWVPRIGYCYMDRRGNKADFDGMRGTEATPVEAFGFRWAEDRDGMTRFYLSDIPPTASYRDGEPRRWQSSVESFEWRTLKGGAVATKKARA
jgi:hypothetical protein